VSIDLRRRNAIEAQRERCHAIVPRSNNISYSLCSYDEILRGEQFKNIGWREQYSVRPTCEAGIGSPSDEASSTASSPIFDAAGTMVNPVLFLGPHLNPPHQTVASVRYSPPRARQSGTIFVSSVPVPAADRCCRDGCRLRCLRHRCDRAAIRNSDRRTAG